MCLHSCCVALLLSLLCSTAAAASFYVSPSGSDRDGDGTKLHPFATLQRAQLAVRQVAPSVREDIVVNVGAGRYYLSEPLLFTAADVPAARPFRTIIRGATTADTHTSSSGGGGGGSSSDAQLLGLATALIGGVLIPPHLWKPIGDGELWHANVSSVLPLATGGAVPAVPPHDENGYPSVGAPAVPAPAEGSVRQSFVLLEDGHARTLARHPDAGSGYLCDSGCTVDGQGTLVCPAGIFSRATVATLQDDIADVSVFCNTGSGWDGETRAASAVTAAANGSTSVRFYEPARACGGPCNERAFLQGSRALITEPGEWALDSARNMLYFWPSNASAMVAGHADVVIATTKRLLDVRGASYDAPASRLTFERLALLGSDFDHNFLCDYWTRTPPQYREGMVRIENATDVQVRGCLLRDAGHSAVCIEGWARDVAITDNWIERPGFCGVLINGPDPGATAGGLWRSAADSYVNHGHLIHNNLIYDVGQRSTHGAGVWVYAAGDLTLTNNYVREGPRDAFGVYGAPTVPNADYEVGPDHFYGRRTDFWYGLDQMATHNVEIARNRISNVVRDSVDSGALEFAYVGRNNTAHTNCFSDLDTGLLDGSYLNFLFQDDGSHFVNFSSNIVFGVHGHGLPDAGMIKSVNSVFANTIVADSTLGFLFNLVPYTQPAANMVFERNVFANLTASADGRDWLDFFIDNHTNATLRHGGAWADGPTPYLFGFNETTSPSLDDPVVARWDDNLYWQVTHTPEQTTGHGWDLHAVLADPRFARRGAAPVWNRTCKDYALAEDSPMWAHGFRKIDVESIGLLLHSWPFDLALVGRIDAVQRKVQAERYQRMHGLWRNGGTGIAPGPGFDPNGAWARYDNLVVDCELPCAVEIRMASVSGTKVQLAAREPTAAAVVGTATVKAGTEMRVRTVELDQAVRLTGEPLFLLLTGECYVDYFQFVQGK